MQSCLILLVTRKIAKQCVVFFITHRGSPTSDLLQSLWTFSNISSTLKLFLQRNTTTLLSYLNWETQISKLCMYLGFDPESRWLLTSPTSPTRQFYTYTSLSTVKTWSWMASGDIHLIGSFLFFLEWYTFPAYTSRDNPKSATFTSLPSQTRTFLAARSRCTNPLLDRNFYVKWEMEILITATEVVNEKENGHQDLLSFNEAPEEG